MNSVELRSSFASAEEVLGEVDASQRELTTSLPRLRPL